MKRILLLLVLSIPLPACEDQCGNDVAKFFDVQNIQWQADKVSASGQSSSPLGNGESVSYLNLRLGFAVVASYYSLQKSANGQAFACSPAPGGYQGTSERVDSLVVFSRYDYDAAHPAGHSLNDLLALDETLSSRDIQITPRNIAKPDGQPVREISLRLKQAPTASSKQQFLVRYRQTNGEAYAAETPVLTIVP